MKGDAHISYNLKKYLFCQHVRILKFSTAHCYFCTYLLTKAFMLKRSTTIGRPLHRCGVFVIICD